MRNLICFIIAWGICATLLNARSWTSSDGSRTFEGTLRSYNSDTGEVTVLMEGRPVIFPESKLSAEDIAFIKEEEQKKIDTKASKPDESSIGAAVLKAKLHRLDGKRFRRAELEKAPEYYIFYFSASWCPPCRAGAPKMVEKYQAAIPENSKVTMIHVSLDRSDDAAKKWAIAENFPWLTILPDDRERSDLMQFKTTRSVPECIVYRPNGEVVTKGSGAAFKLAASAREGE